MSKAENGCKKAVITILGIQGGIVNKDGRAVIFDYSHKPSYRFENDPQSKREYFNTLELLIDTFGDKGYEIVPIYTKEAKLFNQEVLQKYGQSIAFDDRYLIEDEKNFDEIFSIYNVIIERYDKVIVDVSHGFRHLPLLMLVELMMQNFENPEKIEAILFAKQIVAHTKETKGEYEIIDLKDYVELSNIAFLLTTFDKNYTVASHITSKKYQSLIESMNSFSNDIMALSLNNLFTQSSRRLIKELGKIENVSIRKQAQALKKHIEETFDYKGKKRYQTYFDLAKNLFEKKYMFLSLSLLNESARLFVKSKFKERHPQIMQKVEKHFTYHGKEDLYKIGDFVKKLTWKNYSKDVEFLSKQEYKTLQKSIPESIKKLREFKGVPNLTKSKDILSHIAHTRNDLAHANSRGSFADIEKSIQTLLDEFEKIMKER